ncbi:MAG: glycosyltransferase family 39 protein, partial [Phycisphaeraceae bacterium]
MQTDPHPASDESDESELQSTGLSRQTLTRMAIGLIVIGLLWRIVRYLLAFPIWGDEAMLGLNFVWYDYGQLTTRLDHAQVAPLLFLWGERAAFTALGPGELSMRLLPFLAGTASLALFWRLATLLLTPLGRLLAVGFFAVAIWPVSMSTFMKPYALDLFMSLALLVPAVHWLQRPERLRWLIALAFVAPVAMLSSYPAVFVAGGVSLALAQPIWKSGWKGRGWFAVYNLLMLGGFITAFIVGRNQLATPAFNVNTQLGMADYWRDAFPPASPLAAIAWFFLQIAGEMTAYPAGASNGGSIVTFTFFVVGIVIWMRGRRWTGLILFLAPILLNLVAAIFQRYPFGDSGRVCQHLGPGICILAGLGAATVILRARMTPLKRKRVIITLAAVFALLGIGGMVRDAIKPYRDMGVQWSRSTMKAIRAKVPAKDRVVICGKPIEIEIVMSWHWANEGERVTWDYELPALTAEERIWGFAAGTEESTDAAGQRLLQALSAGETKWKLVERMVYLYLPQGKGWPQRYELFCFSRVGAEVEHHPGRVVLEG